MNENAFLHAILGDPDDDTARLIFADWLEERGDPRGEFIRAQIALTDPTLNDLGRMPLLIRERALLAAHEKSWRGPIDAFATDAAFARGFIQQVSMTAKAYFEHAEEVFALAPIQALKIRGLEHRIRAFAATSQLERLTALDLSGNGVDDSSSEILAQEARLSRLRRLDLSMNFLDVSGVRALAAWTKRSQLETLILDYNPVHDLGVHALTESNLIALHLSHAEVSPAGARYLASARGLAKLEVLDLSYTEIGERGAVDLAQSKALPSLRELRLRGCGIGAIGARNLGESTLPGRLRILDLRDNAVSRLQQETLHQRFGDGVCVFG